MVRRRNTTRAALVDAARTVISRKGVDSCSVSDICEEAGFTRGAFYSSFEDKDALLLALLEEEAPRIAEHLRTIAADQPAPLGPDLTGLVARFLDLHTFDPVLFMVRDHLTGRSERGEAQRDLQIACARAEDSVVTALTQAAGRHGLRFTLTPDDTLSVLSAILQMSALKAAQLPDTHPSDLARRVLPNVIDGITEPIPG